MLSFIQTYCVSGAAHLLDKGRNSAVYSASLDLQETDEDDWPIGG